MMPPQRQPAAKRIRPAKKAIVILFIIVLLLMRRPQRLFWIQKPSSRADLTIGRHFDSITTCAENRGFPVMPDPEPRPGRHNFPIGQGNLVELRYDPGVRRGGASERGCGKARPRRQAAFAGVDFRGED